MDKYAAALERTFRSMQLASRRLVVDFTRSDRHLREMALFALDLQTPSEYPFVFKYAFCRREEDGNRLVWLGAAIHLIQTSTFVTDDIFDSGTIRYGRETVHVRYGISYAVIVAELLQSIALETIARELHRGRFVNTADAWRLLNRALLDVYLGQYLDIHNSSDTAITRREYYRTISLGAGRFFAALARCGALLAGKSNSEIDSLTKYGHAFGMALFITDDVIDLIETRENTGKSIRADLRQRRMRLPVILALQLSGPRERAILRAFLKRKAHISVAEVTRLIKNSGAIEACEGIASDYRKRALKSLAAVRTPLTKNCLWWLAEGLMAGQGLEPSREVTTHP